MKWLLVVIFAVYLLSSCSQITPTQKNNELPLQELGLAGYDATYALASNGSHLVAVGQRAETSTGTFDMSQGFVRKMNVAPDDFKFGWDRTFSTAGKTDRALDVVVDSSGNSYVSTLEYSPSSPSFFDTYVRKYNVTGQLQWRKRTTGIGSDHLQNVNDNLAVLNEESVLIPQPSPQNFRYVLRTYSSAGTLLKTVRSAVLSKRPMSGTDDIFQTIAFRLDKQGNIYILYKQGAQDGGSNLNNQYLGMIKLNSAGNTLWDKIVVGVENQRTSVYSDFQLDSLGNIYLISNGVSFDTFCFFPQVCGSLNRGYFLRKLDSNGTELWKKQVDTGKVATDFYVDGSPLGFNSKLIIDSDNTLYVAGSTATNFPGYTNQGKTDIFVVRLDADGNRRWVKQFGTAGADVANDLTISNGLFVGGIYDNDLYATPPGNGDAFIVRISRWDGRIANNYLIE